VIARLAEALGVDAVQWRALVAAYIRMDFRAVGGPTRRNRAGRNPSQVTSIAIVGAFGGAFFAFVAATTPDLLMSASLLTTYTAATTIMMLLVDFTSVVLAPEDYAILAPRPVGSRTYFAARLAAVAFYVVVLSVATAAIPCVVYGVKAGLPAAAAALAAVVLSDLTATVLVNLRLRRAAAMGASLEAETRDVLRPAPGSDNVLPALLPGDGQLQARAVRGGGLRPCALAVAGAFDVVRGVRARRGR
jgi:hypothetical protein